MEGYVSLLKSKSGFLIENGYFVSLLKSKNGLLRQMIHNGDEFFGSYLKPDTLIHAPKRFFTTDPKRVNIASGNTSAFLTRLLILTAIFEPESWVKRLICPFYRGGKIAIQTGPASFRPQLFKSWIAPSIWIEIYPLDSAIHLLNNWGLVTRKKLHRRVLQDFTFPIHILFQDPSKAVS